MRSIKYLFAVSFIVCAAIGASAQNLISVDKYGPFRNSIPESEIDSMTVDAEGNITVTYLDKSGNTILRDYMKLYIGEDVTGVGDMNIMRWMVNSDRDLGSNALLGLYHHVVTEMPEAHLTLFMPRAGNYECPDAENRYTGGRG